jgi:hypothetical protein
MEGEGPLVLLHGFPFLWYLWRNQIRALAARATGWWTRICVATARPTRPRYQELSETLKPVAAQVSTVALAFLGVGLLVANFREIIDSGLLTGFNTRIAENSALSAPVRTAITAATEQGIEIVTIEQAHAAAVSAGLTPSEADAVPADYADAQLEALKKVQKPETPFSPDRAHCSWTLIPADPKVGVTGQSVRIDL